MNIERMSVEKVKQALDSLVEKGMLIRDEDGNYRPTEKGRLVAKNVRSN